MFASIYAFYRYVKVPSIGRLILVGVATGLALACKHTGILVFPMLLMLAIAEVVLRRRTVARVATLFQQADWSDNLQLLWRRSRRSA